MFINLMVVISYSGSHGSVNSDYNKEKGTEKGKNDMELEGDNRNLCGLSHSCYSRNYRGKEKKMTEGNRQDVDPTCYTDRQ